MRLLGWLFCVTACLPVALPAADFEGFMREFSRQTGAQRVRIPFFGLARFVVAVAHPAGTSELKLAVFENVDGHSTDLARMTDRFIKGDGWNRIVRVKERNGDSTNIYMQPDGSRLRMLLAVLDGGDATFVQMKIRPEQLESFVNDHCRHRDH